MNKIDDGGPAFPQTVFFHPQTERVVFGCEYGDGGMTLRDHFAGEALIGCLSSGDVCDTLKRVSHETKISMANALAQYSYQIADAMIEQRKK